MVLWVCIHGKLKKKKRYPKCLVYIFKEIEWNEECEKSHIENDLWETSKIYRKEPIIFVLKKMG